MKIDTWQAPLLVIAGIILVELVVGTVLRRRFTTPRWKRARTTALLLLACLVVGVADGRPESVEQPKESEKSAL